MAVEKTAKKAAEVGAQFGNLNSPEVLEKLNGEIAKLEKGEHTHPDKIFEILNKNKSNLTPETYEELTSKTKKLIAQSRRMKLAKN